MLALVLCAQLVARDHEFFEDSSAWRSLFDGRSLDQWRFLHEKPIDPRFWTVEDGFARTLPGGQWGADIITRDEFKDFAFCAEWKVAPGGNSGILFNVKEDQWRGQDSVPGRVFRAWSWLIGGTLLAALLLFVRRGPLRHDTARALVLGIWVGTMAHFFQPFERLMAYAHYMRNWKSAGLEMQLYDDDGHRGSTMRPSHGNAALYDIFAPTSRESRPAGEWNESCVVIEGLHVQHWLNGVLVLEFQLESPEFEQAVARSRYRSIEGVTRKASSRIALQNHDGQLTWFRSLRIRELNSNAPQKP
jgi:hypothetical protein